MDYAPVYSDSQQAATRGIHTCMIEIDGKWLHPIRQELYGSKTGFGFWPQCHQGFLAPDGELANSNLAVGL